MTFDDAVQLAAEVVEGTGVAMIVVGIPAVLLLTVARMFGDLPPQGAYRSARRGLGRVILLGLEVLVAADIIRTVAVELTLRSVAVLAAVVAIRTFLSWSIEMEVEGRLPWRARGDA